MLGFMRKPKQPRTPDGKYAGPDGTNTASRTGTVAARGVAADMLAVKNTLQTAFDLTNTIQEQALKSMEMRARHQDMLDDLEGDVEADNGIDFESMALKTLLTMMQNGQLQGNRKPTENELWEQGVFIIPQEVEASTKASLIPPAQGHEQQGPAQGVDRLNQILQGINRIPDKVVSRKAIDKICRMEGIDKEALQGFIKKLAPVMV